MSDPQWRGTVHSIHIAPVHSELTVAGDEARLVPGRGLEGDRYFKDADSPNPPGAGRDATLIELETIEALERDYKLQVSPGDARRNIVTRGVPLNHLVGKEFTVGGVRLRGVRLNEPCDHLAGLTSDKLKQGLVHRGGLRADIVSGGVIRVGDEIRVT